MFGHEKHDIDYHNFYMTGSVSIARHGDLALQIGLALRCTETSHYKSGYFVIIPISYTNHKLTISLSCDILSKVIMKTVYIHQIVSNNLQGVLP